MHRVSGVVSGVIAALLLVALPSLAFAQAEATLGTIGAGAPNQSSVPGQKGTSPSGPAPRLPNGKPDLNGVWDHPYVPDMGATNKTNPALQTGAGEMPYTAAATANLKAYDPEKNGDYTGMCMPFGLARSMNAPYPIQIMQTDKYVAFLFEQNTWFHVVPFRNEHSTDVNPTWFGESIARWDGDTLVVDTVGFNGFTRLDTKGNPHSDQLHLVQTFTRTDAGHIAYTVTVDDPVFYTTPWANRRTFTLTDGDLIEYSCEENNRSLWEGRIKIWVPPSSNPVRTR
jgi:hypothetical protein